MRERVGVTLSVIEDLSERALLSDRLATLLLILTWMGVGVVFGLAIC